MSHRARPIPAPTSGPAPTTSRATARMRGAVSCSAPDRRSASSTPVTRVAALAVIAPSGERGRCGGGGGGGPAAQVAPGSYAVTSESGRGSHRSRATR
jgi:hypothetical protein